MLGNLSGWQFLIIIFVIVLLFGAPKLPGLAKSIGQSMKILKKEVGEMHEDSKPSAAERPAADAGAPAAPSAPVTPATAVTPAPEAHTPQAADAAADAAEPSTANSSDPAPRS